MNPTIVLLHGWMDCGGSYRFVAEHLADTFHLVAPDLRGFGETQHAQGYWFADYFADLDKILDCYAPDSPANIVGHSMGGNIVLMYAGIKPSRICKVMSLEALGLPPTRPSEGPEKYRQWMREILSEEPSKVYSDEAALKYSIRKGNPTLDEGIVTELVTLWGTSAGNDGSIRLKHDHAHHYVNPMRYNFDDVLALWGEITAEVGLVMAEQSSIHHRFVESGRIDHAREVLKISDENYSVISDSAHMLHLEQPAATAAAIDKFFS